MRLLNLQGEWTPASGSRHGWRVCRERGTHLEEYCSKSGNRIYYKSFQAAYKKAAELNLRDGEV